MSAGTFFVVLSPVWNAKPWVERCVDSVRRQTYSNIRHIWVDDASTDGTAAVLKQIVRNDDLLLNAERRYPSYNVWNALTNHVREDCLVGLLDGDDWLIDETAVERMVLEHKACEVVWSAHEVHEYDSHGELVVKPEPDNPLHRMTGNVRTLGWEPTHFFSFKRHRFLQIHTLEFQADDHTWFQAMYDMALSVPLIEMAGWSRCCHIAQPLYAYNRLRPDNDDKVRRTIQQRTADIIRQRRPYLTQEEERS